MHIGTRSKKFDITLEKDTKLISQKISNFIKAGEVILLFGEIGVGKTTFVKHLINFLQKKSKEKETEVPSPTFNIVNEYKINDLRIMHYDLFRIKDELELKNLGFFEKNGDEVMLIEWPEIIKKKPNNRIELNFIYEQNMEKRSLTIKSNYKNKIIDEFK